MAEPLLIGRLISGHCKQSYFCEFATYALLSNFLLSHTKREYACCSELSWALNFHEPPPPTISSSALRISLSNKQTLQTILVVHIARVILRGSRGINIGLAAKVGSISDFRENSLGLRENYDEILNISFAKRHNGIFSWQCKKPKIKDRIPFLKMEWKWKFDISAFAENINLGNFLWKYLYSNSSLGI